MNQTLEALERLRAEWVRREGRRARGGVASLSGFHFQLLSTLRERVLVWCSYPAARRALPSVIDEFLSDAVSVTPDGGVVITQAKRVLRAAGVADALGELWRIDELAREAAPELAPRLEYRVRTAHAAIPDASAAIAAWKPGEAADAGALASFLARTRAEVLGDPMEELLATLANELNAPDPLGLVRRWLGLLLERTAEGAAVDAARQIWSDLWGLQAAEAVPPAPAIVHWQNEWAPPAELRPGGYLTGQRPTVLHLREGYFAPRPDVYHALAARAEGWIAAAREQAGGVRLPVFWIGGRSGVGKSVALLHVLAILHEREHGPVLWLGNKTALLSAAMSRARTLRFRDAMAIVAVDDPYSPAGQADPALVWREALATVEAVRQVGGAAELPLVICCGPSEQAERFRDDFPDDVDLTLVEIPRETDADLARLREWYRVRAGREPPEVGDRNVLLVQLFFEWRVQATLPEFAARLRTRIRASGADGERVYEFLAVMLAVNRLYVGLPAPARERELTAEQQDLLDILRRDHHLTEDVRAGEMGLWLAHPHLSNAIYESWFPHQKNRARRDEHLRTGVLSAVRHGSVPSARTAALWAIVRGVEANETAAGDVVGRIDRDSLPRLLARIHQDLCSAGGPALPLWLLPVWVGLRAACPAAELHPDPVAQALAELRPENVGRVGLRLTCHMLIRYAAAFGEPHRRAVAAGIVRVLSGAPDWYEWLPIALDALRGGIDGGLADLAAEWAVAHPASSGNAGLLLAAWSVAPGSARVEQAATRLLPDAPATFGWGDVGKELLGRAPAGTMPAAVAAWCERHRKELPAVFLLSAALQKGHAQAPGWAREWAELWHMERSANFVLEPLFRHAPGDPGVFAWSRRWVAGGFPASGFLMEAMLKAHGDDPEVRALAVEWLRTHPTDPSWPFVWRESEPALGSLAELRLIGLQWLRAMPRHPNWPSVWLVLWSFCAERRSGGGAEEPDLAAGQTELDSLGRGWLCGTRGEKSSWWYVFSALWKTGAGQDALAGEGVAWLGAADPDEPTWGRLWTLLWDSGRSAEELEALGMQWLRKAPRHGSWGHVCRRLWEAAASRPTLEGVAAAWLAESLGWMPVQWPYVWQLAWTAEALRDALVPPAVQWLELEIANLPVRSPGERSSWFHVFSAAWKNGADPDALDTRGIAWLRAAEPDEATWGRLWTLLWDARRRVEELEALGLAWLCEAPRHGSWGHVFTRLWDARTDRPRLEEVALQWLEASLAWLPVQWPFVWQTVWATEELRRALAPLAVRWLGSEAGNSMVGARVFAVLRNQGPAAGETGEVRLAWLRGAPCDDPAWARVWRSLWAAGEHRGELAELALAWLVAAPEHWDWSAVLKSLWTGGAPRAELVRLALDWLGKGVGTHSQRARVTALFTTPENGDDVVPELSRWLAAAGPAHPAWAFVWRTLVGRGVEVSPAPGEALAWVRRNAPETPGWENVWLGVWWLLPEQQAVLGPLGIAWLRHSGSLDGKYGDVAKALSAITELRAEVIEVAGEHLRAAGVDAAAARRQVAAVIWKRVEDSAAPVQLSELRHPLQEALGPLLQQTSWLGSGSLRSLIDSLGDPRLATAENHVYVPGVHELPAPLVRDEGLRDRVAEVVREYVAASPTAVVMADAAQHVRELLGPEAIDTTWAGYGGFKPLLESVEELGVSMLSMPSTPGYLFIPGVHPRPEPGTLPPPKGAPRVNRWSWRGPPPLAAATYAEIFRLLADLLPIASLDLGPVSRVIGERLDARGLPTPRNEIVRIITGISIARYPLFAPGPHDPRELAELYAEFMIFLSWKQDPPPSDEDHAALRELIVGAL